MLLNHLGSSVYNSLSFQIKTNFFLVENTLKLFKLM